MSTDWLEAEPQERSKVLRQAKSRIDQEFGLPGSPITLGRVRERSAASPLSKGQVISYLAEKVHIPKRVSATFFEELFRLAVRECKGAAGKIMSSQHGRPLETAPH